MSASAVLSSADRTWSESIVAATRAGDGNAGSAQFCSDSRRAMWYAMPGRRPIEFQSASRASVKDRVTPFDSAGGRRVGFAVGWFSPPFIRSTASSGPEAAGSTTAGATIPVRLLKPFGRVTVRSTA